MDYHIIHNNNIHINIYQYIRAKGTFLSMRKTKIISLLNEVNNITRHKKKITQGLCINQLHTSTYKKELLNYCDTIFVLCTKIQDEIFEQ